MQDIMNYEVEEYCLGRSCLLYGQKENPETGEKLSGCAYDSSGSTVSPNTLCFFPNSFARREAKRQIVGKLKLKV
jgi:hypothetical protein